MLWKLVRDGTDETLVFAAQELKKYVSAMDRTQELAILEQTHMEEIPGSCLHLAVKPELAAAPKNPFFDDVIQISVEKGRGVLYGSNSRSVLIAVYRFLRELGCAFLRPGADGEVIPQKNLNACRVCVSESASYRHRGITIEGANSYDHVINMIDWMPKLGMNAYFNQFLDVPFVFYDRWYSHLSNETMLPQPLSTQEVRAIRDISVQEIKKRGMLYHAAGHGWTCEPFGLAGGTWDVQKIALTESQRRSLAEVNGKREIWQGITLNSNLCYSNPDVRKTVVQAVLDYLKLHPQVDLLHLWLADGYNNHCECSACVKKLPSEWYVVLLNEIDAAMEEKKLPQKIVFLLYFDLLWKPVTEKLNHPERFVMMFAPITRTYSESVSDAEVFDESKLPPYVRNRLSFPKSVSENLAWLRQWQKTATCDSFDFDYHYMWDHFKDPGYDAMARILLQDIKGLHKIGLQGLISCQLQRTWFPSGLGMHLMAQGLWDETTEFEPAAKAYYEMAFGADGKTAAEYLKKISDAFDPRFMRRETENTPEEDIRRLETVKTITDSYLAAFRRHAAEPLPEAVRTSWALLVKHTEYCKLLSEALIAECRNDGTEAQAFEAFYAWAKAQEPELAPVLDVYLLQQTLRERQKGYRLGEI